MIKTWQQRCEEHPDHNGIVSERMIQARMQEEIDELRAALEQAQPYKRLYELRGKALERPCSNCGHHPAKIKTMAQQIQTVPAKGGLAEKVPAKGTLLEQTLKRAWDEMPHTALMDALVGGTGVMLGDKRIDPASIYKQPEQTDDLSYARPTRHWQGLTPTEIHQFSQWAHPDIIETIETKLKDRNP